MIIRNLFVERTLGLDINIGVELIWLEQVQSFFNLRAAVFSSSSSSRASRFSRRWHAFVVNEWNQRIGLNIRIRIEDRSDGRRLERERKSCWWERRRRRRRRKEKRSCWTSPAQQQHDTILVFWELFFFTLKTFTAPDCNFLLVLWLLTVVNV